jgi:DNA-binding beta-propeller fold protein YncE
LNLTVSETTMPFLDSMTVIANGFPQRTDPNALVIGATGVALSPTCQFSGDPNCATPFGGQVLYVADTLKNRIAVITDPFTRTTPVWQGTTLTSGGNLNAPLGLNVAADGHILAANGGNGWAVEITPQGAQIATKELDSSGSPPGAGALFGLLWDPNVDALIYVDDATNTLNKAQ